MASSTKGIIPANARDEQAEVLGEIAVAHKKCVEVVLALRCAEELCGGCVAEAEEHVKCAMVELSLAQAMIGKNDA